MNVLCLPRKATPERERWEVERSKLLAARQSLQNELEAASEVVAAMRSVPCIYVIYRVVGVRRHRPSLGLCSTHQKLCA